MRGFVRLGGWRLVVSLCTGCAGTSELAAGEAEAEPPVEADASRVTVSSRAGEVRTANAARGAVVAGAEVDSRWVGQVRAVVSMYARWGRVDDEFRWAPGLCRMPMAARARFSESDDPGTHGDKLYTLYALDPVAYGAPPSKMVAPEDRRVPGMSQVIVKESFSPVPIEQASDSGRVLELGEGLGAHDLQPAERDGQRFVAGERRGLYLMMKPEAPTEGTDAGWIYATVAPDFATVTAVGVIESCAGCHAEAGEGRLFGLPGFASPKSHDLRDRVDGRANAAPG